MRNENGPSEIEGCPPEWTYSVYVDRELEPDELRAVETHLVGCRSCRERVVALEREATSLRAALFHEEAATAPVRAAPAARSLAISASTSVGLSLVCLTVMGWIIQVPVPTSLDWLNPFALTGAFSMFFDTVSALRRDAPAIYQLALSTAALFSAAFLLTASFAFTVRRFANRETALLLIVGGAIAFSLWAPTPAFAVELRFHNEAEIVAAGEVVEQTWVTSAETVTIEGTLRGDLIVFGDRVVISGVLDGNLLSGARKLEIPGQVTGSIIAFGERVRISGDVQRNVYAATDQTTLTESGRIGRDFMGAGDGVLIAGVVGRDAMTIGSWIDVSGTIEHDLSVKAEHVDVGGSARIGGDLDVTYAQDESSVDIDPRANIAGATAVERKHRMHSDATNKYTSWHFYVFIVVSLAAAFLAGMVMFRLAPWVFGSSIRDGADLFRALAFGLLTLITAPIACALIALTMVGIPLAVLGVGVFAACVYFAKIVVAGIIGTSLLGRPDPGDWRGFGLPLLAGLTIIAVATALPFIGGVIGFLALLTGLGTIVSLVQLRFQP
jgi:cytoskeletal protein CcmA (bactofilin family)